MECFVGADVREVVWFDRCVFGCFLLGVQCFWMFWASMEFCKRSLAFFKMIQIGDFSLNFGRVYTASRVLPFCSGGAFVFVEPSSH